MCDIMIITNNGGQTYPASGIIIKDLEVCCYDLLGCNTVVNSRVCFAGISAQMESGYGGDKQSTVNDIV